MKTVLITGATRGIGKDIAKKFKANGYRVLGTGTTSNAIAIDYLDDYCVGVFTDLSSIEKVCEFIKSNNVDILINNAGINKISNFLDIQPGDFLDIQQVNVFAPFRFCQAAIPNMLENNWGRIVNISSVWGKISKIGRASYSASKFAIDGFTVALANEYASKNILANSISPGFIDTDMTRKNLGEDGIREMLKTVPINRLAQTDEISNFIYFLASEQNTYISGQNIAIDGGFTRA